MLQSGTKEIDLVLDRGGCLYEVIESVVDLSGQFLCLANARIRVIFATFLTDNDRRMSRAGVKRRIRSKSSVGSLSIEDRGSRADMVLQTGVVGLQMWRQLELGFERPWGRYRIFGIWIGSHAPAPRQPGPSESLIPTIRGTPSTLSFSRLRFFFSLYPSKVSKRTLLIV